MKDTLVSFEVAILAKEKGFNKKVLFSYEYSDKKSFLYCGGFLYNSSKNKYGYTENLEYNLYNHNSHKKLKVYSAPTQSLLQKWLREKHGIYITIIYDWHLFNVNIMSMKSNVSLESSLAGITPYQFTIYENALEAGLIEGLKFIK